MQSAALPARYSAGLSVRNGEQFVIAEPDAAHSWFPANDHPTDKATFSFTVTVPTGSTGAANGELTGRCRECNTATELPLVDGCGRWRRTSRPWSSEMGGRSSRTPSPPKLAGSPIRNMLPLDLIEDATGALGQTGEMINVLEEAFGPYPFDRYGIAVVDGWPHALENQTLSVFGRSDG